MNKQWLIVIFLTVFFGLGISLTEEVISQSAPCDRIKTLCNRWNGDYSGGKTWCQCNYGAGAFCNTKAGNNFLRECKKIGGTGGCMLGTSYCQYSASSEQKPSSGQTSQSTYTQTGSRFTLDEAKKMVAYHNQIRKEVGVSMIKWSDNLAAYAQEWSDILAAKGCNIRHRPYSGKWKQKYGENIAISYEGTSGASKLWASEKKSYHGQTLNESNLYAFGHYTQMIWRKSTQIGCGKAECGGKMIVVCNYNPAGNMTGEKPY